MNDTIFSPDNTYADQQKAWDTRYRVKGRQWGNAPCEFSGTGTSGIILELGIGDGKNIRVRKQTGSLLIGIDFSTEAIRLCHSDPVLATIPLLVADTCLLPVRDRTVSLIFAHHILGHIPTQKISLMVNEMYRVLMPGGRAAVTVFGAGDMRDGTGIRIEPGLYLRGDGIVTRYFFPDELKALFSQFILEKVVHDTWEMKIRGKKYPRSVLMAEVKKPV